MGHMLESLNGEKILQLLNLIFCNFFIFFSIHNFSTTAPKLFLSSPCDSAYHVISDAMPINIFRSRLTEISKLKVLQHSFCFNCPEMYVYTSTWCRDKLELQHTLQPTLFVELLIPPKIRKMYTTLWCHDHRSKIQYSLHKFKFHNSQNKILTC